MEGSLPTATKDLGEMQQYGHNAFALQCSHLLDCCNPPASTSTIVNSAWPPTPPPFSPSVKFPARQKSGPEISKHASKNSRNVRWTPKIDTPLSKLFSVQWSLVRTLFFANPSFLQSFGQNGRCRKYIDVTQDKNDMDHKIDKCQ